MTTFGIFLLLLGPALVIYSYFCRDLKLRVALNLVGMAILLFFVSFLTRFPNNYLQLKLRTELEYHARLLEEIDESLSNKDIERAQSMTSQFLAEAREGADLRTILKRVLASNEAAEKVGAGQPEKRSESIDSPD